MTNLLIQRHPDILDIGQSQANKILKYTSLDENGNVIECLQRLNTSTDFVDITEVERERIKAIQAETKIKRLKQQEYDNDTESNIAD